MSADTTLTFVEYCLPAYWAPYLVNGDATGCLDVEVAEMNAFLATIPGCRCVNVSDDTEFQWRNDANNVGGDVATFTFQRGATV